MAKGLFTAAGELVREGKLSVHEESELKTALGWFGTHVPVPDRFSKNRNASHKNTHGLSWYKSDAVEALKKMRGLVSILEEHGLIVETVRTKRPGYIVYEDEIQIVAEPFHGEI